MKQQALFILALFAGFPVFAQTGASAPARYPASQPAASALAIGVATAAMELWPDSGDSSAIRWTYDEGVVWKGLEGRWYNTGDARYFKYLQHQADRLIDKEGHIRIYDREDYIYDRILCGRLLLLLYTVTGQEKYYKAAATLRQQVKPQLRTSPFFAEYASLFHEDSVFDDIRRQFAASEKNTRDNHAGRSAELYALAMGWYGMTLVDVLDYFPASHPGRKELLTILRRQAAAIQKIQDNSGNDLDVSASSIFTYTLAKGVRKGYLAPSYRTTAEKAWQSIQKKILATGAGVDPNRVGGSLLAAGEMEMSPKSGKTILLDYYFNNEHRKDITGAAIRYHYIWDEMDNNGYSLWGHIFRQYGAYTDSLPVAPTASNLAKASVYIIVDPDNEKESPAPNYPSDQDIVAIENWVKAGGVLVLMANDSANCEFTHFNRLAGRFGIQFNYDDYHKVIGDQFEMGAFTMTPPNAIFLTTKKIYIKELSTLELSDPAKPVFTDAGHNIMAVARVGKGTVFAVGDPWFYNEYTDGRKLPADFENYNAARDLAQWLLQQAKTK